MKTLRIAVVGVGIVGLALLLFIAGSRALQALLGQPYWPWDAAPDSLRHRLYDAAFMQHRWLTAAAFAAYGAVAIAVYRRGTVESRRGSMLGILGLLALAAALATWISGL